MSNTTGTVVLQVGRGVSGSGTRSRQMEKRAEWPASDEQTRESPSGGFVTFGTRWLGQQVNHFR